MKLEGSQQAQLRELFADHFNLKELHDLCLDIDLEYEELSGSTRTEKIRDLIALMNRHGRIEELLQTAQVLRPNIDWKVAVPAGSHNLFPLHQIAYPHNPNFTGRSAILDQMEKTLSSGQTTVVTQAIAGLGGVGKTQLALAYCYMHLDQYDLIYWLAADNEASLGDSFRSLAQRLKLATAADTDQQAIVQRVLLWLGQAKQRWLLVFDNADQIEPKQLADYLPYTGSGQMLITSRNPNWRSVGSVLELNIFSEEEAVVFLNRRTGKIIQEDEAEKNLAATLGYFPLALEHAAAYVEATGSTYATYQQLFETMREDLWDELEEPKSYHATITTTWKLAFKQIKQVTGALQLLNLCCFLAPDEIPFNLIIEHAETLPSDLTEVLEHPINRDKAVRGLLRYSLIQRNEDGLSIHRLVQMVARDRMSESLSQQWAEAAILFLSAAFVYDEYDMDTWPKSQRLLSHNQAIVEWSPQYLVLPKKTVQLLNKTGEYFIQFGNYQPGHVCIKKAVSISEDQLGTDHPDTAQSLNNLGRLLQTLGDLAAARPFYERALDIRENALGSDHPDTAQSLNDLGSLLSYMGNLAAALPFYERALAIRENALGPDHPGTAQTLNNLGLLLQDMGNLAAALPFYERALVIDEEALGPDHPDTATDLNNLGFLMQAMGDLTASRQYYERALAIDEKALGPEHPNTAGCLNNLGTSLLLQGKLVAARDSFERALKIIEKTQGENHPILVKILTNLGGILVNLGQINLARQHLNRARTICREAPVPYAECLETEEILNRLPGKIGKPKKNKKKRRR